MRAGRRAETKCALRVVGVLSLIKFELLAFLVDRTLDVLITLVDRTIGVLRLINYELIGTLVVTQFDDPPL